MLKWRKRKLFGSFTAFMVQFTKFIDCAWPKPWLNLSDQPSHVNWLMITHAIDQITACQNRNKLSISWFILGLNESLCMYRVPVFFLWLVYQCSPCGISSDYPTRVEVVTHRDCPRDVLGHLESYEISQLLEQVSFCNFPIVVVPRVPSLGLTPSGSFMGFTKHFNLHFRVNSWSVPPFATYFMVHKN